MSRVCILTDSTAQFTSPSFPGCELVSVLPVHIRLKGKEFLDPKDLKLSDLPASARNGLHPLILPYTIEELQPEIESLAKYFDHVILILTSSQLNPAFAQSQAAIERIKSRAALHRIDSKATSVGLGMLVQMAAEAAAAGMPVGDILRMVRATIPHIYSIFCVHNLTYLHHAGHLDPAQAFIGEMLGLWPFLLLENGRLVPVHKARNTRHLVETLHEFISEFDNLRHLALLQGVPPFTHEARNLYERILEQFPNTAYSEHTISYPLAATLGPRSLGVIVMEKAESHVYRNRHR